MDSTGTEYVFLNGHKSFRINKYRVNHNKIQQIGQHTTQIYSVFSLHVSAYVIAIIRPRQKHSYNCSYKFLLSLFVSRPDDGYNMCRNM